MAQYKYEESNWPYYGYNVLDLEDGTNEVKTLQQIKLMVEGDVGDIECAK